MLKSSLCDYSDAHILQKGTIVIKEAGAGAAARQADETNKQVILKNCAPVTDCRSEVSNTQVNNAKNLDVVMSMYKLIEHSNKYSRTSGRLWQH